MSVYSQQKSAQIDEKTGAACIYVDTVRDHAGSMSHPPPSTTTASPHPHLLGIRNG